MLSEDLSDATPDMRTERKIRAHVWVDGDTHNLWRTSRIERLHQEQRTRTACRGEALPASELVFFWLELDKFPKVIRKPRTARAWTHGEGVEGNGGNYVWSRNSVRAKRNTEPSTWRGALRSHSRPGFSVPLALSVPAPVKGKATPDGVHRVAIGQTSAGRPWKLLQARLLREGRAEEMADQPLEHVLLTELVQAGVYVQYAVRSTTQTMFPVAFDEPETNDSIKKRIATRDKDAPPSKISTNAHVLLVEDVLVAVEVSALELAYAPLQQYTVPVDDIRISPLATKQ